ncbi:glycosyltransferase family 39 protein [Phenylobacterium sp. LjRoot225]|uniref:glycosyltransferase family 39 protein n=1 Tax=Phenylobacterium sp. LjRoot225 TaxID=3342285 RepID=UPI003ECCAD28
MPHDRIAFERQGLAARLVAPLSRWAPAICLAIILAGLAIRILALPHSLWVDEVASVRFAEQPWSHLWSDWMRRETNPPLFYSALKAWIQIAGGSDLSLRIPSIFYGCASIALAYVLGDRLSGPWAGLAAAALVAVSPAEIQYSLEIRGYGQAQLAALVSLLGLINFCDAERNRARWAWLGLYAAGCTAALYSHTMLLLYPAIASLWVLAWLIFVRKARPALWLEWIAANTLVLAAYAWWLSITLWQVQHPANIAWIERPTLRVAINQVLKSYGPGGPTLNVVLAATAMLAAFCYMMWLHRRRASLVLPLCAIGAPTLLFALSMITPVMLPRAFFWAVAPFLIAVAIGVTSIRIRAVGVVLFGLVFLLNLSGARAYARRPDPEPYRQIVAEIRKADPTAIVVANNPPTGMSLDRYCPEPGCPLELMTLKVPEWWTVDMPRPNPVSASELPNIIACAGELYTVVRGDLNDPSPLLASLADPEDLAGTFQPRKSLVITRWRIKPGKRLVGASQCEAGRG